MDKLLVHHLFHKIHKPTISAINVMLKMAIRFGYPLEEILGKVPLFNLRKDEETHIYVLKYFRKFKL